MIMCFAFDYNTNIFILVSDSYANIATVMLCGPSHDYIEGQAEPLKYRQLRYSCCGGD